jgi:hypothetical protein
MGKDYFPVLSLLLFEINPPNSVMKFARYLTNILLKVQVDSESENYAKRFTVYSLQYKIVHGSARNDRFLLISLCFLFFLCKAKKT